METNSGPEQPYDPRDALSDIAESRAAVADRLITPWWYHPTLGAILAALVLVGAFDMHNAIRITVGLACAVGVGILVGGYQRTTGLWVDIRNLGPSSLWWWVAYLVLAVVIVGISLLPSFSAISLPAWLGILLAVTIFVGTIGLGRRMDEAMRADIRSGASTTPKARR